MTPALQISDLTLSLGGHEILSGVNATINEGEFIGIFGPNGAGKTTLVRAIIGTLPPTRGRIEVLGLTPGRASRQIGYMPQGHSGFDSTALSARALVEAACHGDRWGLPWTSRKSKQEVDRVLAGTLAPLFRAVGRRAPARDAGASPSRPSQNSRARRTAGQSRSQESSPPHRMRRA